MRRMKIARLEKFGKARKIGYGATLGESEHMRDQREEKRINIEQLETTKIGKGLVQIYFEEDT